MARIRWWAACLPALMAAGAAAPEAAPFGSTENTQYVAVWTDAEPGDGLAAPALLNMPPGWGTGDAAAVIAPGGPWDPGQRDALIAALLDSGATVLELGEPRLGPRAAAIRVQLAEAHHALREVHGAGLVVVLGTGEGGDAALAAAEPAGERAYAAGVRLGPGEPAFRAGIAAAAEAWPARAPLFCAVLAAAQPDGAAGFAQRCSGSLALAH